MKKMILERTKRCNWKR